MCNFLEAFVYLHHAALSSCLILVWELIPIVVPCESTCSLAYVGPSLMALDAVQMKACVCAATVNDIAQAEKYLESMIADQQEGYADIYQDTADALMKLQLPELVCSQVLRRLFSEQGTLGWTDKELASTQPRMLAVE